MMEINPLTSMILYLFAASVNFIAAVFNWMRRDEKGFALLGSTFFSISLWSVFCALELTTNNLNTKIIALMLQSQLSNIFSLLFLLFVSIYYEIKPLITKRANRLLWTILSIQVLFELTNPLHHLMWQNFALREPANSEAIITHGPMYPVSNGLSLLFLFAAIVMVFLQIFRQKSYERSKTIGIFIAAILPLTVYVIYLFASFKTLSLTWFPIVYAITGLLISFILFRDLHYQILQRNKALETSLQRLNREIAERKQTEAALQESEERFNRSFRGSPIGIFIFDMNSGRAIDINEAFLDMSGYTREEIIGRTPLELNMVLCNEPLPEWFEKLRQTKQLKNSDAAFHKKNGEIMHVIASVERLDLRDKTLGMALITDVSRQKSAELSLEAANKELEKALGAKDDFMSAMSHELRTPLTVILGQSQMLQIPEYGPLNLEQTRSVEKIYASGKRLQELITDILEYSQMLNGDVMVLKKSYRLDEICQEAMEKFHDLAALKELRVHFSSRPENITLYTDKRFINHILRHLLNNANKFTPNGGEVGIELLGNSEKHTVTITIWDTGIGIKEEDFPRLFQSFVQLDSRLSRKYRGVGLGLAFVKQLTDILGGSTYVESTYGKGSRFSITLPWVENEHAVPLDIDYHETWNP